MNLVSDYLKDNPLHDKNLKIFKINYSVNYEMKQIAKLMKVYVH